MDRETTEEIKRHFDGVAEGLRGEFGGLRTKIEDVERHADAIAASLRTDIEDVKRHADVIAKSLRTDIRTVAEGFVATNERLDGFEMRMSDRFGEMEALIRLSFKELDRRIASG